MRKHPYQKLLERKRTWTPVKPTKGVIKEGAEETIKMVEFIQKKFYYVK